MKKITTHILLILCALFSVLVPVQAVAEDIEGRAAVRQVTVEHEGKTLDVSFTLQLAQLEVPSGKAVVYTPLYIGTGVVTLPGVVVAGRRESIAADRAGRYEGQQVVRRDNGTAQAVPYVAAVPWEAWMETGKLYLYEDYCGCGIATDGPKRLLAEVDLGQLPDPESVYLRPAVEAQKVREVHGSAYLDFPVNRVTIHPDYRDNKSELRKIIATIDTVRNDPNTQITAITIHGFASPEGSYANNRRLASGRAAALSEYVRSLYDFPAGVFSVGSTPENWEGLRRLVAESPLVDRKALLDIIDSDEEPDAREARMKQRFPDAYAVMLRDFYPALRRSDYTVRYTVRPFTTEEVLRIVRTRPSLLSQEELFTAAGTFPDGSDEFNELMELAVRLFPDDPTANLNAAVNALRRRDLAAAERYLTKAGDTPQATHARGILAYLQEDYEEALRLLEASGVAPEANLSLVRKAMKRKSYAK